MGPPQPVTLIADLRASLEAGAYDEARRAARALPQIASKDLLRLAILAAQRRPQDFDLLARDWIGVAIEQRVIRLKDLTWLVPTLSRLKDGAHQEGDRLLLIVTHRARN